MYGYRKNSSTVYYIKYDVIWVIKYKHKGLYDQIIIGVSDLIRQGCEAKNTLLRE